MARASRRSWNADPLAWAGSPTGSAGSTAAPASADRRLTEAYPGQDDKPRRFDLGESFLVLASAVLVVRLLALLALGVWLVVASGFFPTIVLGLLFIAAVYALRPRIGSVRRFLDDCHELSPTQAPALHALINEIAERTGAPAPDIVALDMDWNAGAATVGVPGSWFSVFRCCSRCVDNRWSP